MVGHDEHTRMADSATSIKHRHPELYGKLLEVNAALQDAGGALVFVYLILLLGIYCGLWFEWYKRIPLLAGIDLGNVWIYALVFVLVFGAWIGHFQLLQWHCYRQSRQEIIDFADRAKVTRYQLLAEIEKDSAVRDVAEALKRDRWEQFA
jgi:hypothetical protein